METKYYIFKVHTAGDKDWHKHIVNAVHTMNKASGYGISAHLLTDDGAKRAQAILNDR